MTVSLQTTVFSHTGNGIATSFAFGCRVLDADDLVVTADGVVVSSGFTVSGIGEASGGTVDFSVAPAAGVAIIVQRLLSLTRATDYQQFGDWRATEINPDFDRTWMALQQQQEQIDRSLKFPVGDAADPPVLPPVATRASRLLAFDASGNITTVIPDDQSASALALQLTSSGGAGDLGQISAFNGAVESTVQDWINWQSLDVMNMLSLVQRIDVMSGAPSLDLYATLQAIFDGLADGTTLTFPDRFHCKISQRLMLKGASGASVSRKNIRIIAGAGNKIESTSISASYPRDGIVIGNPSATDGGTGTAINIQGITVDGFEFINCRMGVWVVYGRHILVQNIKAERTAVVGVGNDADDNCEHITLRNIYRTGAFAGTFYTVGLFSTKGFRLENIQSPYSTSGEAITISTSTHGTIDGIYIDQEGSGNSGLSLTDGTQYVTVNNFIIRRCGLGIVTIDSVAGTRDKVSVIGNGVIEGCTTAISAQASGTTFHDIRTSGNTTSLALGGDAVGNKFRDVNFSEATLTDASAVKYLQSFDGCDGVTGKSAFFATDAAGAINVTGDGTAYTMTFNSEVSDVNADFNAATGVFTAPRDGIYSFTGSAFLVDWASSGFTSVRLDVVVTGITILIDYSTVAANGFFSGATQMKLTKGNTAKLVITAAGGTKNADMNADAQLNHFSGTLVCPL